MGSFISSLLMGPLILAGGPTANGPFIHLASDTVQTATAGTDSTADHDPYKRQVIDDVKGWQNKVDDFGRRAKASGKADSIATERDLNTAWIETKAAAQRLQTAGAADWESAKVSYEDASRRLAAKWDKVRVE